MGKDLNGKELGKGIRQNNDGRYEARYYDRFGKRKSIYGTSKVEIKSKLNEVLKENAACKSVRRRLTVDQWYEEWMEIYKVPVIRSNTKRHYEHIFKKHILPYIGKMYLDEVRQMHIQKIINKLDDEGYQWETQNKVRVLVLDLFGYAIDNDYAFRNPSKGVRLSKTRPNDRVALSLEEQKVFFECSAGMFYNNLFVVAVNTGLRPGELCALVPSEIDFEKKVIYVNHTLLYQKLDGDSKKEFHLGPPKTKSSVRTVPINSACEKALKNQFRLKKILSFKYPQKEFADLLFVTKFNTPICSQVYNDVIKRVVVEINLQRDLTDQFPEFSAHAFRHTFATRCIEAGIQPKTLQKYLGHATLQMTMDLYVHITEEFKQEEIRKLETNDKDNQDSGVIFIKGVKAG